MKNYKMGSDVFCWMLEKMPDAFAYHKIITDQSGEPVDYLLLDCNKAFEEITGLKRSEVLGRPITEIFPGIENSEFDWIKKYGEVALNGTSIHFEQYSEPLDAWYEVSAYSEKRGFFVTVFRDVTERREIEKKLRTSEMRYRTLHDAHQDVICRWKPDTTLTFANDNYCDLFGLEGDLSEYRWIDFLPEAEQSKMKETLSELIADPKNLTYEHKVVSASGEIRWYQWKDTPIYDGDRLVEFQSTGRDITKLKEIEEKLQEKNRKLEQTENKLRAANLSLEKLSRRDSLTELGNRREFDRKFEDEWERMNREGAPISLIIFDIDHFKNYNDHYGHPEGDRILHEIGQTIARGARRPADCAARIGGEEFALILPYTGATGAENVANEVLNNVRGLHLQHSYSNTADVVTISAGVATCVPGVDNSLGELLIDADRALYRAKSDGRNCVRSTNGKMKAI